MTAIRSKASEQVPRRLRPGCRWTCGNAQPTSFGRDVGRGCASRFHEIRTLLECQLADTLEVGTGRLFVRSDLSFDQ
jgi:hypothetical protein